jgi:glycosyltransferase involved in cell wall biosynthesis
MYGAEAMILNLCAALNAGGEHQASLGIFANSADSNTQLQEAAQKAGLPSQRIHCGGQLDRRVPSALRALALQNQADIIHAHGYKADVYTYAAFRRLPLPLVSTCHNWIENDLALRLYGFLDRLVLRNFDAVVAVSDEVRARLLSAGVPPQRVSLISNGVDIRPFAAAQRAREQQPPTSGLHVGIVARLSPEKGVDVFLRSAANVHKQSPQTRFFIAGDGPERAALEALLAELGLAGTAFLHGRTTDMPGFYASIDVMVSASHIEGLPIAILEGMASGLPIVATRVGAVPQVIRDAETGLLVPPADPAAMASAVLRLLGDAALRHSLGSAAQQLAAERFSADAMAAEYVKLYRDARTAKETSAR